MRVLDTYEMLKNQQKLTRMMTEKEEEFNLEELDDPDSTCFDKCYVRCGKGIIFLTLARKDSQYVLESTIYELVVNFINFVNLIALLIRDVLEAEGISYYDAWSISQIVINFLFLIDLLLRIWIHSKSCFLWLSTHPSHEDQSCAIPARYLGCYDCRLHYLFTRAA